MDAETFRGYGHRLVDWVAGYMKNVERYPVLPRIAPGDVSGKLPEGPPLRGEAMEAILEDFERIILPGVTHWNHPRFFAYFPANHSGPAILGELLSAGLGINGMVWQSCPAATELEEVVMDWLRQMLDLPPAFRGVIQDTASSATLCALLCAREQLSALARSIRRRASCSSRSSSRRGTIFDLSSFSSLTCFLALSPSSQKLGRAIRASISPAFFSLFSRSKGLLEVFHPFEKKLQLFFVHKIHLNAPFFSQRFLLLGQRISCGKEGYFFSFPLIT